MTKQAQTLQEKRWGKTKEEVSKNFLKVHSPRKEMRK